MRYLLLPLAILVGCASPGHQKLIVDNQSNLFNGESLLRVSGKEESNCYKEDLASFTEQARAQYAKGAKSAQYWSEIGNCMAWHAELRESRFFLGLAQDLAKTNTEKAMVKNNIAVVYLRQGRISRAYELLKEARELAPKFVTPSFNLAQLYVSQNINKEALKILEQPPCVNSNDAEVLHLRGLAHLQLIQVKTAGLYLSKIPSQFHQRADIALTIAQWHVLEGRPDEALTFLDNRQRGVSAIADKVAERVEREAKGQIAAREAKK